MVSKSFTRRIMADEQVVVLTPEQQYATLANQHHNFKDFVADLVEMVEHGEEGALNCTIEITFGN